MKSKNIKYFKLNKQFKASGRNNQGKITVRHRGGGVREQYKLVDFRRRFFNQIAVVHNIEKDSNRTGRIALVLYRNCGLFSYYLCPDMTKVGDFFLSFKNDEIKDYNTGFSFKIKKIPLSVPIHNIEIRKTQGARLIRSAGCFGIIVRKIKVNNIKEIVGIKLPSNQVIYLDGDVMATLGKVSNGEHHLKKLYKAGQTRWLGIRPHVRGVAMNPVDHPHGGGEGKSSGGRPSVSPWGKLTKGYKTLSRKKREKKKILMTRINKGL